MALKIISALISAALKAAAVSVEKNGLPVPQAKITILPFSRCTIITKSILNGNYQNLLSSSLILVLYTIFTLIISIMIFKKKRIK